MPKKVNNILIKYFTICLIVLMLFDGQKSKNTNNVLKFVFDVLVFSSMPWHVSVFFGAQIEREVP